MIVRTRIPEAFGQTNSSHRDIGVYPGLVDDDAVTLGSMSDSMVLVTVTREDCIDLLRRMDECKASEILDVEFQEIDKSNGSIS